MNPRVFEAVPTDDYKLHLRFRYAERGLYDCSPLLDFGFLRQLRDKDYFRRVMVLSGSAVWPHEQDICPDTL